MSLINYCALTQTWHTWPTSAIWHFPFLAPRDQILRFPKVDETMMKHRSTWILDHYLRNMWMIHFWIYILEISISTFLDHSPWGCSLLCKDSWRICCCFYAVPVDNTSAWLGSFYQHLSVEMKGLWKGCVSSSQLQFLYPRWYTCAFDPLRWSSDVPVCCFFGNLGHMFSHVFSHISDKQSAESSLLWRKDWGRIGIFHLCNPWLSFSASRWKRWNPGHWGKNSRGVLKPIKYPQTNHYNDITSMDQHLYKSCIIYHLFGIWPFFGHSLRDLSGRHLNPDWRFRSVSTQHQLPATWSSRTRNRCPRCPDFTTPQDGYNMAIIWVGIIWV